MSKSETFNFILRILRNKDNLKDILLENSFLETSLYSRLPATTKYRHISNVSKCHGVHNTHTLGT